MIITVDDREYRLDQTCGACPEQYDIYSDGEIVGYLRLRHGFFTAEHPHCGDRLVYESTPEGDGIFKDYEREEYLGAAVRAIHIEIVAGKTLQAVGA